MADDIGNYRLSDLAQTNCLAAGPAEAAMASNGAVVDVQEGAPILAIDRVIFSDRGDVLEWRLGRVALRNERFIVHY